MFNEIISRISTNYAFKYIYKYCMVIIAMSQNNDHNRDHGTSASHEMANTRDWIENRLKFDTGDINISYALVESTTRLLGCLLPLINKS